MNNILLLFKDAGGAESTKYRNVIINGLWDTNNRTFEAPSTDFLKSCFKNFESHIVFASNNNF